MSRATHMFAPLALLASGLLNSSCLQVDSQPDFDAARNLVEQSTGMETVFDPNAEPFSEQDLEAILTDGLALDEALRVALLNNRELQAEFQEIGIANADWVQAQLLTNPSLDVLVRFPANGGANILEATVGGELLELWRVPVRTEAARQNLEATVLRIARSAGVRLAETRNAYFAAVAAAELLQLEEEQVQLASRSHEAVKELHLAGVADALDVNLALGPTLAAQLAVSTARTNAANAKRELAKQLSISRSIGDLVLSDAMPDPLTTEFDAEALAQEALASRLDLVAISTAIEALESKVRHEKRQAWGDASVGGTAEKTTGSEDNLIGPAVSLSLPIFDQNQAQVAKAAFQLEQMVKLREAAQIAVTHSVRSTVERQNSASNSLAFYNEKLMPQAEQSLELAEQSFAAGNVTLLTLIDAQLQLLETRRAYVNLRLESATSASDLERVVGAKLTEQP